MPLPSEHRHVAAADGTPIAFRAAGDGPALVFTNGFVTSDFYWKYLIERFSDRTRVVTWDFKGHGRSGAARSLAATRIEDSVDDLRRVMDAAGVERAVLLGFSLGCQIILEAWRRMPERIEALVTVLGTYRHPFDGLLHPRVGPMLGRVVERIGGRSFGVMFRVAHHYMRLPHSYPLAQRLGLIARQLPKAEMQPLFDHFAVLDGPTCAAMVAAAQKHSAEELLATVTVPTLVVAGGRDVFTPKELSERMARTIPGCAYFYLPDCTHTGLFEYPQQIGQRIEDFLGEHRILRRRRATDR